MADNAPSTGTTTTPTPAPVLVPPAPEAEPLRQVRQGFAIVVLLAALCLGAVAIYYATRARTLGGSIDKQGVVTPADTWWAGFKDRHVWTVFAWAVLGCAAGLVGAFVLMRGHPLADNPD